MNTMTMNTLRQAPRRRPLSAVPENAMVEREKMLRQLVDLYHKLMRMPEPYKGYPQWMESTSQLMELAWELWHTRLIEDPETHRPMQLHVIARCLCLKLHRHMPANVSAVVRRSKRSGRTPLVDYLIQVKREGHTSPGFLVIKDPFDQLPPLFRRDPQPHRMSL